MAKAQESLIVQLDKMQSELAFRKAAMMLGTIRELEEGHFQIKETDNGYSAGTVTMGSFGGAFSTDKITNPATVDVYINEKSVQETEILIVASCFGVGPIQNNHCKSKLSTVKSAIMVAISESVKQCSAQSTANVSVNENVITEKQPEAPNTPIITVVKTENTSNEKQKNTYKLVALIFAILTGIFYVIVSPLWNHIACYAIILVLSALSFVFCILNLKNEKNLLIQIIAPVMLLIVAMALRVII